MLDLQKGLNKQIADGKFNLLDISVDGLAAIFADDKNNLETFTLTEDVVNNKAITSLYPTTYSLATPNQVKFAANSYYILFYSNTNGLVTIYALDKDGSNPVKLVSDSKEAGQDFDFNSQADSLFIVMQDKSSGNSNSTPTSNLYQIKLNKVQ
jgi:hypothetical protein